MQAIKEKQHVYETGESSREERAKAKAGKPPGSLCWLKRDWRGGTRGDEERKSSGKKGKSSQDQEQWGEDGRER